MDANSVAITVAILASIPGTISLIHQWRKDKHKEPLEDAGSAVSTSESASRALRAYSDEVTEMRGEMKEMRIRIDKLEKEVIAKDVLIDQWRIGIRRLIAQLVSNDMTPVWQPKPEPVEKDS